MRVRLSATAFRRLATLEEQVLRSCMPRTSAVCPEPLVPYTRGHVVTTVRGLALVKPLTVKLSEVAHVRTH